MDEEKVTLWKQRMTSFQSSGLSIKKWCRENHIAPPTFYYWRSRLENEIVSNQPTFVEVKQIEKTIAVTQAQFEQMPNNDYCNNPEVIDTLLPWSKELPDICHLSYNRKKLCKK